MNPLENELSDAPNLGRIKAQVEQPKPPTAYFEEMEAKVFLRLAEERVHTQPTKMVVNKGSNKVVWFAAAALGVTIMALGGWFWATQTTHTIALAPLEVTEEDAEIYLMANLEHYNLHELFPADEVEAQSETPQPTELLSKDNEQDEPMPATPNAIELDLLNHLSDEELELLL
jgi:hypothetical protein